MLLVETYVDKSNIEGLGLFASKLIPKGTKVWQLHPFLDRVFPKQKLAMSTGIEREFLARYGYIQNNLLIVSLDNDRFMNHSDNPNVIEGADGDMFAFRDINVKDELLCNYYSFDELAKFKLQK